MAKKKKGARFSPKLPSFSSLDIDPDTQRGILGIVLLALGIIITFSLFGFAGEIGELIDLVLNKLVGVGRYLVPFIFALIVYTLLYPADREVPALYIIGIGVLAVSLFGLVDVFAAESGGYVGIAITYLFREFASIAVAVVVLLALLVISILIVFNTSIDHLIQYIPAQTVLGKILRFIVAFFSSARHRL